MLTTEKIDNIIEQTENIIEEEFKDFYISCEL